MKKLIFIFLLLIHSIFIQAKVELFIAHDPKPKLVTELYNILTELIEDHPEKNILFYVHGRKKNVEVEKERIIKLEKIYNMKVVMFHWDSYDKLYTRPTVNAENASLELFEAFQMIKDFKNHHPDYFLNQRINLISHSMGNLVLKYTVEKYLGEWEQADIFHSFIGTAPDVPMKDHHLWLDNFKLAKNKYIIMNDKDIVLTFSYALDITKKTFFQYRLGLGFKNLIGKKLDILNNLVSNVYYIDLSDILNLDHGYFASKDSYINKLFSQLLNSESKEEAFNSKERINFKVEGKDQNIIKIKKS